MNAAQNYDMLYKSGIIHYFLIKRMGMFNVTW
jgi:hypothetical protein